MQNHKIWDAIVHQVASSDSKTVSKIVNATDQSKEIDKQIRNELTTIHWSEVSRVPF